MALPPGPHAFVDCPGLRLSTANRDIGGVQQCVIPGEPRLDRFQNQVRDIVAGQRGHGFLAQRHERYDAVLGLVTTGRFVARDDFAEGDVRLGGEYLNVPDGRLVAAALAIYDRATSLATAKPNDPFNAEPRLMVLMTAIPSLPASRFRAGSFLSAQFQASL